MPLFTKPQFNSVWAATGTRLAPDNAKISQGWIVEIPPHEYENWSQNRQDALLAHINQVGIPMWDSTVEYQASKSYVQGTTTGVVYRALTTHTNINPESDIQNNWMVAFQATGEALLKSQNLSDVPDKALARENLGIPSTGFYDGRYLQLVNNLSDVPNKASARSNLGLGNSATLNVGTIAGTVAAGNDSRIVNAVPNTRVVNSGSGLVGGGDLNSDRTITLGTPSTITRTGSNYVAGTTHSHFIDMPSFFPFTTGVNNTFSYELPGRFVIQGGVTPNGVPSDGYVDIVLPRAYTGALVVMASLYDFQPMEADGNAVGASWINPSTIRVFNTTVGTAPRVSWTTYGVI